MLGAALTRQPPAVDGRPGYLVFMLLKIPFAALGPPQCKFHRGPGAFALSRMFSALVEGHDDVGAQADLRGYGGFRAEEVRGAIQVRAKRHALLADLAQVAEAEDLVTAGIGEDGARPGHEAVQ